MQLNINISGTGHESSKGDVGMREIEYRAYFTRIQTMIYQEDFVKFELLGNGHVGITAKHDFDKGGWYSTTRGETNRKTVVPGTTKQVPRVFVMQYTGLKGKYRTKIYEGDITYDVFCDVYGSITYDEGTFLYDRLNVVSPLGECHMDLEVIGNIYENPELLEVD